MTGFIGSGDLLGSQMFWKQVIHTAVTGWCFFWSVTSEMLEIIWKMQGNCHNAF